MEKIFYDVGIEVKVSITQSNNTNDKIVTIILDQSYSFELNALLSASTTFYLLPISLDCRKEIIEWCRPCLENYDKL